MKMKNLANDNEWLWDKNKFINRKYIMQEMYQNYTDGDEWNVDKVKADLQSAVRAHGQYDLFKCKRVFAHHSVRRLP